VSWPLASILSMKTTSLEILEKAELPSAQAHAILKVMESEMASLQDTLATKADLNAGLLAGRAELNAGLAALRAELNAGLAALRVDLNAGLSALRTEILALKADTLGIEGKLTRWVLTCVLGQTAVLASFGYFLLAHWRR